MVMNEIEAININGEDCFTVAQFSQLTGRNGNYIRTLISRGNRVRKIRIVKFGPTNLFIPASEIFDFPFIVSGRPGKDGVFVEKFRLVEGCLITNEELYIEHAEQQ